MLYVQYRYGNSYKLKQTKILFYPPYLRIAQIRTIFLVCYLYSTKALSKLFVITVKERKKDPYQIINTVSDPCCKYMESFFTVAKVTNTVSSPINFLDMPFGPRSSKSIKFFRCIFWLPRYWNCCKFFTDRTKKKLISKLF